METRPKLRFFCDENAPDSLANYLQSRGHSVHRARHHMATGSPDHLVAQTAMGDGRILVSWDRDFNDQRFRTAGYRTLSRLAFNCEPAASVGRLKAVIDLIEFEWASRRTKRLGRMIAHIGADTVRLRH